MNGRTSISLQPYCTDDREECLNVFRSNIPLYFRDEERAAFLEFLDRQECPYWVMRERDTFVGCGGYGRRPGETAVRLCWGMVLQNRHGSRLGEILLLARLAAIARLLDVQSVDLGTSQHTQGFFERYGFHVVNVVKDGLASGLDDVEMTLQWSAIARNQVLRSFEEMNIRLTVGENFYGA